MAYKYCNPNYKNPKKHCAYAENHFTENYLSGICTGSPELNYKFPGPFETDSFKRDNQSQLIRLINKYKISSHSKFLQ